MAGFYESGHLPLSFPTPLSFRLRHGHVLDSEQRVTEPSETASVSITPVVSANPAFPSRFIILRNGAEVASCDLTVTPDQSCRSNKDIMVYDPRMITIRRHASDPTRVTVTSHQHKETVEGVTWSRLINGVEFASRKEEDHPSLTPRQPGIIPAVTLSAKPL